MKLSSADCGGITTPQVRTQLRNAVTLWEGELQMGINALPGSQDKL
jgi:hypothetical protein